MTTPAEFAATNPVPLVRFGHWLLPAWERQAERHFVRTPRGCQLDHCDAAMRWVRSWECAVDGGAHVGSWTLALCKMFDRVLAFEPHPDTYAALVANIAEAEQRGGFGFHITSQCCALGEQQSASTLLTPAGASMSTRVDLSVPGRIPVRALDTIEDVQRERVGFVKLDLEGCEVLALRGARETLARCRPVLLVESKDKTLANFGSTEAELLALLGELGYMVAERVEQDLIAVPREQASARA